VLPNRSLPCFLTDRHEYIALIRLRATHKYVSVIDSEDYSGIPDPVFRKAKARAAERGIPLRQFITEAVEEKLNSSKREKKSRG